MRRLPIDLAGLALAPLLLLAGACSAPPDRETQIHVIQADVEETFGGDTGALIYHGYEAARLAEAADTARAELASQPSWSPADINISDRATEMADQAAEQKRQAEAALDRILDPLRDRIAKLEEAQAKGQPTAALPGPAAVTAVLHFAPGSAAIPAKEAAKLKAVADYIARHPRSQVIITGWADAPGAGQAGSGSASGALSRARANAAYDALGARGLPPETTVSIVAAASPGDDPSGQRAEVQVRPEE